MNNGKSPSVGAVLLQLFPALAVTGVFALVGIVHVTSRVMVVEQGYQLSRLESENREFTRENDRLKLELATLKNPSRLEKMARDQLGMLPPPPGAVVSLRPGGEDAPKYARAPLPRPEFLEGRQRALALGPVSGGAELARAGSLR